MKLTRKLRMEIVKVLRDASEWCCEADSASVIELVKIAQQLDVDDDTVWASDVRDRLTAAGWVYDTYRNYGVEHWFRGDRHIEITFSGSELRSTRYAPPDLLDGLLAEFDKSPEIELAKEPVPASPDSDATEEVR